MYTLLRSPAPGLGPLDTSILPLVPQGPEDGAYAHWLLGPDANSLIDLKASRALTPYGQAATFGPNYVAPTAGGAGMNGLVSPLVDQVEMTAIFVLRRPVAGTGGNYDISNTYLTAGGTGGHRISFLQNASNNTGYFTGRVRGMSGSADIPNVNPDTIGIPLGEYFSLAVVTSADGGFFDINNNISPLTGAKTASSTGLHVPVGSTLRAGWEGTDPLHFAEVILFQSAKTQGQVDDIRARSVLRLAERGITLLNPA